MRLGEANAGCQVALARGSHLDQDATVVRFFAQSPSPEAVSSAFYEMLRRGKTGWQRGERREKRVPRGLNPGGACPFSRARSPSAARKSSRPCY
uniref:Uncharacterized protein n=1 Tax=Peronospora matthiolae TaxID=2874970 RepID=A0AAV1VFZ1_9STRA